MLLFLIIMSARHLETLSLIHIGQKVDFLTAQLSVSPGRDIVSMCYGWLPLELLPQTCSASFQDVFSMPRAYFVVSPRAVRFLKLKCCFTSTETVGLLGTGAQDVHLDFHTAPEL